MNPPMSRKILEILWLVLAVLSLAAGISQLTKTGFRDSYPFFIIFLIAFLIFGLRRRKRLKNRSGSE